MESRGKKISTVFCLATFGLCLTLSSAANAETSFSQDIFPIIEIRCLECHQPGGSGYEASGLDMRTYDGLMKGSNSGTMIVPGNVGESNILTMIEGRAAIRMPHNEKRLSKCERIAFRSWVQQGAQDN
jgi:hypothetical protein